MKPSSHIITGLRGKLRWIDGAELMRIVRGFELSKSYSRSKVGGTEEKDGTDTDTEIEGRVTQ